MIKQQGGIFGRNPVFNSIDASQWIGVPHNIVVGNTRQTRTGSTSEAEIATFTMPAGSMGANGWFRFRTLISTTDNGNNKNVRITMGGSDIVNSTVGYTNEETTARITQVWNRGAENSQVMMGASAAIDPSESGAAITTTSINTAADVVFSIKGTLADATDSIHLEAFSFEVCYIP